VGIAGAVSELEPAFGAAVTEVQLVVNLIFPAPPAFESMTLAFHKGSLFDPSNSPFSLHWRQVPCILMPMASAD
jgi:hypothetical protein